MLKLLTYSTYFDINYIRRQTIIDRIYECEKKKKRGEFKGDY